MRDLFSYRMAFRCTTASPSSSDVYWVLGCQGWAGQGYKPPPPSTPSHVRRRLAAYQETGVAAPDPNCVPQPASATSTTWPPTPGPAPQEGPTPRLLLTSVPALRNTLSRPVDHANASCGTPQTPYALPFLRRAISATPARRRGDSDAIASFSAPGRRVGRVSSRAVFPSLPLTRLLWTTSASRPASADPGPHHPPMAALNAWARPA